MKDIPAPQYTQVPNYILDNLDKFESEAEMKVVLVVARNTFGWHKERDRISLSQLEKATGMTRQSVAAGLARALENGWIERIAEGNSFSYAVVVQKVDQSRNHTSPESRPKSVQKVDQQVVQKIDTQKKGVKKETNGAKGPRPHDELFDAVVEVCRADAKLNGSTVGKVVSQLKTAGYTSADVRAFGEDWWAWDQRTKAPSVWKLKDGISQVRAKKSSNGAGLGALQLPESLLDG
jgi:phage replication O-like protein O